MPAGVGQRRYLGKDRLDNDADAVSLDDREERIVIGSQEPDFEAESITIEGDRRQYILDDEKGGYGTKSRLRLQDLHVRSPCVCVADGRARRKRIPQLTAFFTSAPILASSVAVSVFSANEVGHMAPSSRFATSLNPNVA